MMTNKLLFTAFGLALLTSSTANAEVHRRHGSLCAPKHSSRDLVGADERGLYNASSTTTANVTCAITDRTATLERNYSSNGIDPWEFTYSTVRTPKVDSIVVHGRDLSSTVPFSCYLFTTEEDGFSSWGPTKYMCSASGGCPDSTTEWTGLGTVSFSVDSYSAENFVGVVCNVPPATGSGSSYIKSLRTNDSTTRTYVNSDLNRIN